MSAIRAVLLDFGGTLDSDGRHWSTQFADSLGRAGIRVARQRIDAAFLRVDRCIATDPRSATLPFAEYILEYSTQLMAILDDESELDRTRLAAAVARDFSTLAVAFLDRNRALLSRYRDAFRFAVLSNFTANLPIIVGAARLGGLFDHVICSAIEGVRKPDLAFFRLALDRLGMPAGQVAMIGDSLGNDIAPAKALGMITVWLRGDESHNGGAPGAADHVVSTLPEGLAALSGVGGIRGP